MEIWDERVRLEDARQRVQRLQHSFEPIIVRAPQRDTRGHRPQRVAHRRPHLRPLAH